jgi:hypothetical protein
LRVVFSASLAAVLVGARGARAQQELDLVWRAPPGCPSREFVQGRIRELLGESAERVTHLHVQGDIVRAERRYRLTLRSRDDAGNSERVIESDSCSDLAGAAAVAIGLLIRIQNQAPGAETSSAAVQSEGTAGATAGQKERAADAEKGAADESNAPNPSASRAPQSAAPRAKEDDRGEAPLSATNTKTEERYPRILVQAPLVGIDVGPLPEPRPTLGLALGVRFRSWEVSLGGHTSRAQTMWASGVPRYGAELARATISLQSCYRWGTRRLEGGPCVHLALDRLTARGVGAEVAPRTRHAFVFAAGAGALGRWRLSDSVGLIVSIGAQAQASRPRLLVTGLDELDKLSPLALTAKTGMEWVW